MKVSVRFLGYLPMELGRREVGLELPEGASLSQAVDGVLAQMGPLAEQLLLSGSRSGYNVLFSLNGRATEPSATLSEGDQIAIFPPSAGGEGC